MAEGLFLHQPIASYEIVLRVAVRWVFREDWSSKPGSHLLFLPLDLVIGAPLDPRQGVPFPILVPGEATRGS